MTTQTETPLHFVTVKHTRDDEGDIISTDITFECRGDRASKCHSYPDCDCESWSAGHEHPLVPHDDCWLQDWFDAGYDFTPYYVGDGRNYEEHNVPEGSGPIVFSYDECILWRWADEVIS